MDEEKFLILLQAKDNNWPNLKYWKYPRFDLKRLDEEGCLSDFQFTNQNIICLCHVVRLSDTIKTSNRHFVSFVKTTFCIVLRWFSCPCR